jgi:peptidyl-prolyl cis-trans isomerase D
MLKNMRSNIKSLAPLLWLVILAFIVTIFVDWGGAGRMGGAGRSTIATVGGEKIPVEVYMENLQQRIEALQQQMPELDQNFIQQLNLPQQVLEQIIQQEVLLQVARDMGIQASKQELRQQIMSLPVFQREGQFVGFEQYQEILNWNRMSASLFEQGLERDIIIEKLVSVITSGVTVSKDELWENYKKTNESVKLEYLIVPDDKMELSEEPSSEELQTYFQNHRTEYQIPEKRSGMYVFLKNEDLKAEVQIDEADVAGYYEDNASQFEDPEAVRVSRIFLSLGELDMEMVAADASSLRERLEQGDDFAELAKRRSQDEKAESGGDWGEFEWRRLSQEEQTVIQGLEQGELSQVVELTDGASLLKVVEKRPAVQKSLDQVREQIQGILLDQEAQQLAEQRITQLEKEAKRQKSLESAAQKIGLTVQDSGFLAEGDPLTDIDTSGSISRALFTLTEEEISTPVFTYTGSGLVQLQSIEVTRPADFTEVADEVKEDLDLERRTQLALEKAAALKQELADRSFEHVAERHEFELKTAEEHKREQYLGVIGESPEVDTFAFVSPFNQISDPLRYSNGYILLQVLDRTEVTPEDFEQNINTERKNLLDQKRNKVFASFYSKLREEKVVKPNYNLFFQINQDVLAYFNR